MKCLRFGLVLLTTGLAPTIGLGPRMAAKDINAADLYDKVVNSCVFIVTPTKGGMAEGSGSLIDVKQKLVITNYHVVEEQQQVFVMFPVYIKGKMMTDKEEYLKLIRQDKGIKGRVRYRDKVRDLAIVELASVPSYARAIRLAKTSPRPNTPVWQVGNAGVIKQVFRISKGEVSAVGDIEEKIGGGPETINLKAKMVTATNPINPGDSGGPLFDERGYQVAVTESTLTSARLVGMFVDITEVRALLKEQKITIKESSDDVTQPPKTDVKAVTPPKKETVVDTPPPKNDTVAAPPPPKKAETPVATPEEEKAAEALLVRAKLFANGAEFRGEYVAKLKNVIKMYPSTSAAQQAKKLLEGLK